MTYHWAALTLTDQELVTHSTGKAMSPRRIIHSPNSRRFRLRDEKEKIVAMGHLVGGTEALAAPLNDADETLGAVNIEYLVRGRWVPS